MSVSRSLAVLGACGVAAGCALLVAPAAYADNPAPLPASVSDVIARDDLPVQVSNGWEAVTGPASRVDDVRELSSSLGIGSVQLYTGDNESGRAILIFTGDADNARGFDITGGTAVRSVADDTDQPWYVYDDRGANDAVVAAGEAKDIPPADPLVANVSDWAPGESSAFFHLG